MMHSWGIKIFPGCKMLSTINLSSSNFYSSQCPHTPIYLLCPVWDFVIRGPVFFHPLLVSETGQPCRITKSTVHAKFPSADYLEMIKMPLLLL